jgi:hypothetical protein
VKQTRRRSGRRGCPSGGRYALLRSLLNGARRMEREFRPDGDTWEHPPHAVNHSHGGGCRLDGLAAPLADRDHGYLPSRMAWTATANRARQNPTRMSVHTHSPADSCHKPLSQMYLIHITHNPPAQELPPLSRELARHRCSSHSSPAPCTEGLGTTPRARSRSSPSTTQVRPRHLPRKSDFSVGILPPATARIQQLFPISEWGVVRCRSTVISE